MHSNQSFGRPTSCEKRRLSYGEPHPQGQRAGPQHGGAHVFPVLAGPSSEAPTRSRNGRFGSSEEESHSQRQFSTRPFSRCHYKMPLQEGHYKLGFSCIQNFCNPKAPWAVGAGPGSGLAMGQLSSMDLASSTNLGLL